MAEVVTRVVTESGSIYDFDIPGSRMRRVSDEELRGDGEWLRLFSAPDIIVGEPLRLMLEALGSGDVTIRFSTPVVHVSDV